VLSAESEVDQLITIAGLPGVVVSFKVVSEVLLDVGERLFTVGLVDLFPCGTAVLALPIGESEQAGGADPFLSCCRSAGQAEQRLASEQAVVPLFEDAQRFGEGGVRGVEVPAAQMDPAEVQRRRVAGRVGFAPYVLRLLEMMPGRF
jgi:hypothetical protein